MSFDAPLAESVPTRRSSRTSPTPVQASQETPGASRAELRRQAGESATARPAVVWGRPAASPKTMDAAPPVAPVAQATTDHGMSFAPASMTDSAEPAPAAEEASPTTPEMAATAVAAVAATAASIMSESVAPEPVEATTVAAVEAPGAAPLSRRARRAPRPVELEDLAPVSVEAPAPVIVEATPAAPAPVSEAAPTTTEPFELLEPALVTGPVTVDAPVTEPVGEQWHAASDVDEFEAAARLFSFTGETPIQQDAEPEPEAVPAHKHTGRHHSRPSAAKHHAATRAAKPSSGTAFKRVTAASFSIGVMGIVGLLTVGMTTPAEAVAAATGNDISSAVAPGDTGLDGDTQAVQAYVAPATAQASQLDRDENYSTVTMAQLAQQSGIQNFSNFFVNNPNSPIQWPFAVGVPISYGFGWRSGEFHEGVDFTPGAGSPIQAIADGVVRIATYSGGAYGVTVVIDHHIDGQLVSSRYAHMQYGSLQVSVGQHVTVGTVIGRTGNTGHSFGAHTHVEILMNGVTPIDPIPWLRAHAGG